MPAAKNATGDTMLRSRSKTENVETMGKQDDSLGLPGLFERIKKAGDPKQKRYYREYFTFYDVSSAQTSDQQ